MFVGAFFLILPLHARYIEHFGNTLDPSHLIVAGIPHSVVEGMAISIRSLRTTLSFTLSLLVAIIFFRSWRPNREPNNQLTRRGGTTLALITIAALCHSATLQLREFQDINKTLMYNPVLSFYLRLRANDRLSTNTALRSADFSVLTSKFTGKRHWIDTQGYYPFLQTGISQDVPLSAEHSQIKADLQSWLKTEQDLHGPWNIIIVLQESLRANELEGFADAGEFTPDVVPNFKEIQEKSLIFTEVMSTGSMTHLGQTAALCSLYCLPRVAIMPEAPYTSLRCLPDIFADKQYESWFVSGSDNRFDRQQNFYRFHKTDHIIGINEIPKDTAKGNWGASDHAMFKIAVDSLALSNKPFFATLLTLSFHWPFKLPDDAPSHINKDLPDREQVRQYIDWSFGEFIRDVDRRMPHTLVIMLADHGVHYPDEMNLPKNIPWATMRKHFRIPLLFYAKDMPSAIAGKALNNLISNADLPPTLLALLGDPNQRNQFMGQDAFSRREPFLLNFAGGWRWITPVAPGAPASGPGVESDQSIHEFWGALQQFDRFFEIRAENK